MLDVPAARQAKLYFEMIKSKPDSYQEGGRRRRRKTRKTRKTRKKRRRKKNKKKNKTKRRKKNRI